MKILLTGSHGYIGAVTGRVLVGAGHEVTGLDSYLYAGCDLGPDDPAHAAIPKDVRDVDAAELGCYDAIVHLAALSNDPIGELSPDLTRAINLDATVRLAQSAKEAGVGRFIFASSCSMYGASDTDELVDEEAPLKPLTAYAESKVRAEEALAELADADFSPIFMRNATAYGVSPRLRLDIVLNNLSAWGVTTGAIRIMSDGTPWRPLVHVEDISRATLALLEAPRDVVHAEPFNVGGSDENYQVRELAELVREAVGDCTVEYAGSGDPDPRSYRVSFAKLARALPDLELTWTARRGTREVVDALRVHDVTLDVFESDRFIRLRRIDTLLGRGDLDGSLRPAAYPVAGR
jgi:nucleoside-diphosphate-sugar epimerase